MAARADGFARDRVGAMESPIMRIERVVRMLRLRLRSLFRGTQVEQELDEELRDYIERRIEQGIAGGLCREDARNAALRAMGGLEQRKEECREHRRLNAVELANLLLARMGARAREVAVRLALGASRGRIVRQLLTESLLLTAMGCALAVWLAGLLGQAVVALISSDVNPMFVDLRSDWQLFAFAVTLAGLTCALFGLAPALRSTRIAPGESMKLGSRSVTADRSHTRFRRVLVATQLALSLVLLMGGLLFGRSLFGVL
jgi:hypothetical protein